MKDASREEAILWCIENNCDFYTPVFPPPNGWAWAENSGNGIVLSAIFTNTVDYVDITFDEVLNFVSDLGA